MEPTGNRTIVIGAIQEAGHYANSIVNAMYESYVSRSVVSRYLVMPHVRHLGLLLGVKLEGSTTRI